MEMFEPYVTGLMWFDTLPDKKAVIDAFDLWTVENLQVPGALVTGWWYNLHVSFLLAESENAGRWLGKMCSILLYNAQ